jgi:hypothetical protein
MKATIVKSQWDKYYSYTEDVEETIEAPTKDDLFGLFFREFDNRFKYCNDLAYSFKGETNKKEYRTWISDINNYAANGGDMW